MEEWGEQRGFPIPPKTFLPQTTVVAYDELGEPVYSVCLYKTDSDVAWIGWQLSNPIKDKEVRQKSFLIILEHIERFLEMQDYKHIITTTGTPPVEVGLSASGYMKADTNINQYIKNIRYGSSSSS